LTTDQENGMDNDLVLYTYTCVACLHAGSIHIVDDGHDGEKSKCSVCGADVSLEWDGGVTFDIGQYPNN
jgi:transcription elongation factor Elf1